MSPRLFGQPQSSRGDKHSHSMHLLRQSTSEWCRIGRNQVRFPHTSRLLRVGYGYFANLPSSYGP